MKKSWPIITLSELIHRKKVEIMVQELETYSRLTIHMNGGGISIRDRVQGSTIGTKFQFVVKAGQLVLSKIDARNGAFGIVPLEGDDAIITGNFWAYDVNPELLNIEFFNYLTKTPLFIDFCVRASDGTTNRLYLQEAKFLAQKILLPPIEEQHRIVARIEELVAKIEKARRLHQDALDAAKALSAATTNALFNLTRVNNWPVVELGDIADIHAGVTLGRSLNGSTLRLPYLRVANVQDGFLDLSHIKETDILSTELEKWQLRSGDILLTEGGDWDKLGRGAVWHAEIPDCIHQNHIFCVRTNPDDFNPLFLLAVISSPYGKAYFQGASKQTTNLASINQKQLKAFKVFQPPLPEQERIVSYLNDLQAKVSMLKIAQTRTSTALDAMLPSILDKAFKGEL